MTIRELIKFIFNKVYDINSYTVVIDNSKWYKKNSGDPWLKVEEPQLEISGAIMKISLPNNLMIVDKIE